MKALDRIADLEERAKRAGYRVDQTADDCGMTRGHFNRCIHARFGVSARSWIASVWLKHVLVRLDRGELGSDLFKEFGHSSHPSFSRRIKLLLDTTPSSFQGSNRAINAKLQTRAAQCATPNAI